MGNIPVNQWLTLIGLFLDGLGALIIVSAEFPYLKSIFKGKKLRQIELVIDEMPHANPPTADPFIKEGDELFDSFRYFLESVVDSSKKIESVHTAPVYGPETQETSKQAGWQGIGSTSPSSYAILISLGEDHSENIGTPEKVQNMAMRFIERKILIRGVGLLLVGFVFQIIAVILVMFT